MHNILLSVILVLACALTAVSASGCASMPAPTPSGTSGTLRVLAAESFIADIAQNVAGNRQHVETLMPLGADPHAFEPAPSDVARIAEADILLINGAGLEGWLANLIATASVHATIVEVSAGLEARSPQPGELAGSAEHAHEVDPHFWMNPLNVIRYVENIRDALGAADPAGMPEYSANAEAYIARLKQLDAYISQRVAEIPPEKRLLVTNHENFGYLADRYGFTIIGTIIPNVSTEASPSAQQLAQLVDQIRSTGTRAIFLEAGVNPKIAQQIAEETGARVVTDLYTHTLTPADGPAPTYLAMMQYDIGRIVEALK